MLVDDHRLMVEMTTIILERSGFLVSGSARRLSEVSALLEGTPADVALVDHSLPDGRGSDAIRPIHAAWPDCRLVLLTGYADREIAEDAIASGADGVMLKEGGLDALVEIVRRAAAGEVLLAVGGTAEAATRLGITESTYRVHLHHAMKKSGVAGRLAAISMALRLGIIRPPDPISDRSRGGFDRPR